MSAARTATRPSASAGEILITNCQHPNPHSLYCACSTCWAGNCGAFGPPDPIVRNTYVPRKSVGDSWGVWVALAVTASVWMWMAYKFWEGLSQ